jgi:hypothetical protein
VNSEADRVADLAGRPLSALTRRDVALALLTAPSDEALDSLPGIRRGLLAAGNPLSAVFWTSAEAILQKISDGVATVGDVRTWLEATGTEPNGIIGLHVWDEMSERSQLAAEMHTRLVSHLEERLAAGEIDPDLLAAADPAACRAYIELQERWMTSALPDGRVPMDELLDEKDEGVPGREWTPPTPTRWPRSGPCSAGSATGRCRWRTCAGPATGCARTSPGRAGPARC